MLYGIRGIATAANKHCHKNAATDSEKLIPSKERERLESGLGEQSCSIQ